MLATISHAWNEPGHELICLLAAEQLPKATYQETISVLRQHPFFERHFLGAMPSTVWQGSDAEKTKWCLCHAGQWPDMVKGGDRMVTSEESDRFDRPSWHYLDLPIVLIPGDLVTSSIGTMNRRHDLPDELDELKLNALQALELAQRRLKDAESSAPDRAVALCWLCHLVADLHQPCHSASIYAEKNFPDGDQGASVLETDRRTSLHSLWDRSLLERAGFTTVRAKARRMATEVSDISDERAAAPPGDWLDESHALAEEFVYTADVRAQIEDWEQQAKPGELKITTDYLKTMRLTSQQQAALAARRLAHLIESAFVESTKPTSASAERSQ